MYLFVFSHSYSVIDYCSRNMIIGTEKIMPNQQKDQFSFELKLLSSQVEKDKAYIFTSSTE